ncbi:CRISPR-associated helicase Cas3' [Neobacillus sp. YIM B02564]|uniref:CRISPR-associated helicase Cas3 n=1 Tax=Neobacillus paridis TaxID=2803862 RepID=A0ABS1TKG1_9BACI|nr:CRISPR-associated helicase Cas3' [Neobacillus paridis]MBL4951678.1 CRISPR-associated helicase Cas3' [Neobacillus paridis]
MDYIAHIREKDGEIQTVQEHLDGVRGLSEKFGSKIGVQYLAGLSGLLHDLGKNTKKFKNYIQDAIANPDNPPPKGSVDHSTAGGRLLYQKFYNKQTNSIENLAVEWMAMSIISHHSGLRDFLTPDLSSDFLRRVMEKEIPEFENAVASFFEQQVSETELQEYFEKAKNEVIHIVKIINDNRLKPITMSLILKFIFSSLIDADRTNTRMFDENEDESQMVDSASFFKESYNALMDKIASFRNSEHAGKPINLLRMEMSDQCEGFASNPSGIYTLSIPTGGGKTLASLRYALKHAMEYKKERIIYIVPYTTIIEQNAQEVRDILKNDEYILEHHSNIIEDRNLENDDEDYDLIKKKLKLAKDNWDSPIIFTTMVQFLNVFYSKGTRNVRRLHNLSNAILIFDEVQSVPIKCISLFNEALNFLSSFCNTSIVLCTATQPALDFVENKLKISSDSEMIKDLKMVGQSFKRVNIIDKTTPKGFTAAELKTFILDEMEQVNNLLVILNTKTAVRKLFEELNNEEERENHDYLLFHLSTNMCPAHRKKVLKDVKKALSNKKRVICLSTQLIEAGVDISFECVIRSLAGLDSIAQAAGRCNRHGEYGIRNVYIIKSADEVLSKLKEIEIGGEQTARILEEFKVEPEFFGNNLLSPEAMSVYFQYYYSQISNKLNYSIAKSDKTIFDLLNQNQDYIAAYNNKNNTRFPLISRQSFATAEQHFHVIDNLTTSVLVPYNEEAKQIIADLNGNLEIRELGDLLKKSQQYVINVYDPELKKLDKEGNIELLLHGNVYALKEPAYTDEMGLDLKGEGSWSLEIW